MLSSRSCDLVWGCVPECGAVIFCAVAVTPETLALFSSVQRGEIVMLLLCAAQKIAGCRKSDEMLRSKQKVLTYVA